MIQRPVFIGIPFVGLGIALIQIPAVSTLARAMLASAAIAAGMIGIAARAPIANPVSGIAFSQPLRLTDDISAHGQYGIVEQTSLIEIASDLRGAMLHRLTGDGLIGGEADGGD